MNFQNKYKKNKFDQFIPLICKGLDELNIRYNRILIDTWTSHLLLLEKWNKAYNITALTNKEDMISKHLFDSLSISSFIRGKNIVDIGSGGGFPGIPLAILFPNIHFTLIDSIGKKTTFLNHVKNTLKLENVDIIHTRVEDFYINKKFNQVISRAFGSIELLYQQSQHLIDNGEYIIMKGRKIEKIGSIDISVWNFKTIKIKVPFLDASRYIIILKR